jgi:hypothetical protein
VPAKPNFEARDGEIWQQVIVHRWTYERVGRHHDISPQRVSQIIKRIRDQIAEQGADTAAQMRQASLELYHHVIAEALAVASQRPPPVFVGKDGDIARDDDGTIVRDASAQLAALQVAAKMENEIRKLMGLDAATKQEITAAIKYEIVGVDPEGLK